MAKSTRQKDDTEKVKTHFAAIIVRRRFGALPALMMSKRNVNIVEKNSLQTSTHLPNTVRSIGIESIEFDGYEDVYNMEVEDNHNFAVNGGIITHNCDAMRYFVKTMHIADEPEPYNPIWNKY